MQVSLQNIESNVPQVFIVTDPGQFSQKLQDKISSYDCKSYLINYKELYRLATVDKLIKENTQLYFLVHLNNTKKYFTSAEKKAIESVFLLSRTSGVKVLLVLPASRTEETDEYVQRLKLKYLNGLPFVGFLYLGDLISDSVKKNSGLLDEAVSNALTKGKLSLPKNIKYFYPIGMESASELLLKTLFAVSAFNKESFLMGSPIDAAKIIFTLKSLRPDIKVVYKRTPFLSFDANIRNKYLTSDFYSLAKRKIDAKNLIGNNNLSLTKLFKLQKNRLATSSAQNIIPREKVGLRKTFYRITLSLTLVFASLPLFVSIFTPGIISYSMNLLRKGEGNNSRYLLSIMSPLTDMGATVSSFYSNNLPEWFFKNTVKESYFLKKGAHFGLRVSETAVLLTKFTKGISKSDSNSQINLAEDIYLNLKGMYEDLSFMEGENYSLANILEKRELEQIIKLFEHKNSLLGVNEPSDYLFILADNSKINGGGGAGKSWALVTLLNGRIDNLKFLEEKSINREILAQQLSSRLLDKYFNTEAKLSNLNSFSDNRESANRVKWVIDKNSDIQITGVVTMDYFALNEIAAILNIKIDQNKNAEDYYKNVFRSVVSAISTSRDRDMLRALISARHLLDEKHILISFGSDPKERIVASLNWNGGINVEKCSQDCYSDILGINEYSISGSNKIRRETDIVLSFQKNILKRKVTYYIENTNSQKYSTYIKLISNPNSGISPIEIATSAEKTIKTPEITSSGDAKEIGIFVELNPGETKAITFNTESSIEDVKNGFSYFLRVRKNPGFTNLKTNIKIDSLETKIKNTDPASLTEGGSLVYNNDLYKDSLIKLFW